MTSNLKARARRQDLGEPCRRLDHVLEIVKHQEDFDVAQKSLQHSPAVGGPHPL